VNNTEKAIFLGTLFPTEREKEIMALSKTGVPNAVNTFQWNLISGINNSLETIVNVLPVGSYPKYYKKCFLKDQKWIYKEKICYEIGCINLPLIKQISRCIRVKKYLKSREEKEIILYSLYLPFLMAIFSLPKSVKITAVVTDIPEFYDLQRVSFIRRVLRKAHNKLVYFFIERVDRFVLLTEQMKEPLKIGKKPYIVIEGIYKKEQSIKETESKVSDGKIILYSGVLNEIYGIRELLDGFLALKDPSVRLWILGSGEMAEEVKTIAEKDKRISFWGFLERSKVLYLQKQADILINPRFNNEEYTKYSFPSKTMEYMASGKPVLMYKLDGIPKEYHEHLFFIEQESAEGIKNKIEEVLHMDKKLVEEKASKAKAFILENKDSKTQGKKIAEFIDFYK